MAPDMSIIIIHWNVEDTLSYLQGLLGFKKLMQYPGHFPAACVQTPAGWGYHRQDQKLQQVQTVSALI